jgi:hypothetical protein
MPCKKMKSFMKKKQSKHKNSVKAMMEGNVKIARKVAKERSY